MKRRFPWSIGVGFLVALAGLFSMPFLAQFPALRAYAWANLAIFLVGAGLLAAGLVNAFRRPDLYRGKVLGSVLAVISLGLFALFVFGIFFATRVPPVEAVLEMGQEAPDFSLPDQNGKLVTVDELVASGGNGALLIFYRGHW